VTDLPTLHRAAREIFSEALKTLANHACKLNAFPVAETLTRKRRAYYKTFGASRLLRSPIS